MISFARGLVLRRGDVVYEFERSLADGRIQLKRQDTFEVSTFSQAVVYREITEGKFGVVNSDCLTAHHEQGLELEDQALPLHLSARQEATLAWREHYVKAVQRGGARPSSAAQLKKIIDQTARPNGADESETKLFDNFKVPSASTLKGWLRKIRASGQNIYALLDQRTKAPKSAFHAADQSNVDLPSN